MTDAHADAGLLDPLVHGTRAVELTGDAFFLQAAVDVELELTRTLIGAGLAPEWMAGVCDSLTDAGSLNIAAIAAEGRRGGNPVISLVKHVGAAAEKLHPGASDHLHVGATSQDILDSATMLVGQAVIDESLAKLRELADTLARLAQDHRGTVLAGRTLGQQASPTTFGLVAAGWLDATLTAIERLLAARAVLPVQWGGAVGTLGVLGAVAQGRGIPAPHTTAAQLPAALAARLGLAAPAISWHTNRLPVTVLGSALADAIGAVGAFALDVLTLARTEIGEVSELLAAGEGGSSAMPHKQNPVTAVLVVSAARQAPSLLASLYGSLLAEDQRPSGAWHAEWLPLRALERLAVSATSGAASLADRLVVDADRMRANLELTDGLVSSEHVSTILAESIGKAAAFDLVEQASRESHETHRPLKIVLAGALAETGDDQLRGRIWAAFEPDDGLGPTASIVARVLARYEADHDRPTREST